MPTTIIPLLFHYLYHYSTCVGVQSVQVSPVKNTEAMNDPVD